MTAPRGFDDMMSGNTDDMMGNEGSLEGLPTELQLQIMDDLNYGSILALQQTDKYFHQFPYHCDDIRKHRFISEAEWFDQHRKGKNGLDSRSRVCLPCAEKHQLMNRGNQIDNGETDKVICLYCLKREHRFCRNCNICENCLRRRRELDNGGVCKRCDQSLSKEPRESPWSAWFQTHSAGQYVDYDEEDDDDGYASSHSY